MSPGIVPATDCEVAILGTGMPGLCMAIQLPRETLAPPYPLG